MTGNGYSPRVTVTEPPKPETVPALPPGPPPAFNWWYAGALVGGVLSLPLVVILAAGVLGLGFRVFMRAAGL